MTKENWPNKKVVALVIKEDQTCLRMEKRDKFRPLPSGVCSHYGGFCLAVQGSLAGDPLVHIQLSKGLDFGWHLRACVWVSTLTEDSPCTLDNRMHIKETTTRTNSIIFRVCWMADMVPAGDRTVFTKLSFAPSKSLSCTKDNTIKMLYIGFACQEPLICSGPTILPLSKPVVWLALFHSTNFS